MGQGYAAIDLSGCVSGTINLYKFSYEIIIAIFVAVLV